ncbi:MAG: tetratricopeptide repeat protein [Erythrobacter sp.]|uniref:tetratricopeptide repeat protein n=1 Tax=Erythrobacter sp. TaxID=1042 RepID=UPI00326548A9
MPMLHKMTFGLALLAGLGLAAATPAIAQQVEPNREGLASAALVSGDTSAAIEMLRSQLRQHPNDPAVMINLGIALAQTGSEAEARVLFENALTSRDVIELDTADGRTTNSRKLARLAINMLETGEFRPLPAVNQQLTLSEQ